MFVFFGAVAKEAAVSLPGAAFEAMVVVLDGLLFCCFVCVVVTAGFVVVEEEVLGVVVFVAAAAGAASVPVFFFTQDGCAGGAAGSAADFTHGGRNVVLFAPPALSLPLRLTLVIGILRRVAHGATHVNLFSKCFYCWCRVGLVVARLLGRSLLPLLSKHAAKWDVEDEEGVVVMFVGEFDII